MASFMGFVGVMSSGNVCDMGMVGCKYADEFLYRLCCLIEFSKVPTVLLSLEFICLALTESFTLGALRILKPSEDIVNDITGLAVIYSLYGNK